MSRVITLCSDFIGLFTLYLVNYFPNYQVSFYQVKSFKCFDYVLKCFQPYSLFFSLISLEVSLVSVVVVVVVSVRTFNEDHSNLTHQHYLGKILL